jgi:hypothetical protein
MGHFEIDVRAQRTTVLACSVGYGANLVLDSQKPSLLRKQTAAHRKVH